MVDLAHIDTLTCFRSNVRDYAMPEHAHEDHAMLLIPLASTMTVIDAEKGLKRALEPKFFYVVDAGIPHRTEANRAKQEHITFYLNSEWLAHLHQTIGARHAHRAGIWRMNEDVVDLCRIIRRRSQGGRLSSGEVHSFGQLFAQECIFQIEAQEPAAVGHPRDHGSEIVDAALDVMQESLETGISPESLAEKLGVSRRHLSRLFRERTGRSIAGTLRELRLTQARELLRDTRWTILQVAMMCGIENASQFSIAFKSRFDQTPSQFRAAQR